MGRQGCALTEQEVQRIVTLLTNTDMTIPEIAMRMGCSRSAIVAINRKFKVRIYAGMRKEWSLQKAI
jgi:hypothetical protein